MEDTSSSNDAGAPAGFLAGGGEMGARIRAFDWSATPLGAPAGWSPSLRTALRILLSTHHPVFIFWGPELRCFYNDAYARSLGPELHPAMLGARGQEAWAEIWPIIGPQLAYVMSGQGATWHENHLVPITRHGRRETVYWTYSYSPIDSAEAPAGVGGVLVLCTETTPQVLATQRLADAEARWRSLFDQAPGFVAVLQGPTHVFAFANPGYFALIGRDDVIGQPVEAALPWAAEQGFVALLDRVFGSGEAYAARAAPVQIPHPKPGTDPRRYIDFVYQPIRDEHGAVSGIFVLGSDVTERKLAEVALSDSEWRLRVACEAAALGIFVYDVAEDRVRWDARAAALWGCDSRDVASRATLASGLHPDDRDAARAAIDRALDPAGCGRYRGEYRVMPRGEGALRWIQATGRVVFENGRPLHLVGTVQDISERKDADRRRDEFLATLGHELRNPLAPMANAVQLLKHPADAATIGRARDLIERQLAHIVHLLDDLLDVVRVNRGRVELRRRDVDLADVVRAAIETAAPHVARGGHRIDLQLDDEALVVNGDPVRLAQVVSNLLINACKYSDAGGRIVVALACGDDGRATLRVRDRGIGIAPENLAGLFEMFSQAEPSIGRSEGGLGIGLALAKGLVEQHGGSIAAASDGLGRGSEFTVRLPVAPASGRIVGDPAPRSGHEGERPVLGRRRILVVDDNRDSADSMAELLRLAGATVAVAFDGHQALDCAKALRPQVVLLDIGLPGLSGYEVARSLRAGPGTRALRIIAMTGFGQPEDRQRTREAGFDAHLVKPVSYAELLAAIDPVPSAHG